MVAADHPSAGAELPYWTAEIVDPDGVIRTGLGIRSTTFPHGSRQPMTRDEAYAHAGDDLIVTVGLDRGIVTSVRPGPVRAAKAPPLWWAEIRESAAQPPAVNLVALTGHDVAPGAVLDPTALSNLAVTSSDQLGALRWYPATGEVDQVYVQPAHRREGIASCLVLAASVLAVRRDWPRLWGDGQRTQLGEAWRSGSTWQARSAPLTHLLPPMTPGEV